MISVRLLPREEWEAILKQAGCLPISTGKVHKLKTAEWWQTKDNLLFMVPAYSNGRLSQTDLDYVLEVIRKLKPLDWDR